jgi:uncharacterized protein YegL
VTTGEQPLFPIDNPNQRTPCVLVLDASASMESTNAKGVARIDELNRGLKILEQELQADPTARTRVQIAIVCVGGPAGGADTLLDWTDARDFAAFDLTAGGQTPLGEGLVLALRMIESQKQVYQAHGISYTRPWMMVISDGEQTDDDAVWEDAVRACRSAESTRKCEIYPIGVEQVDVAKFQEISTTPVLMLDQLKFSELFKWLSASLSSASRSAKGHIVELSPTSPWAAVKL